MRNRHGFLAFAMLAPLLGFSLGAQPADGQSLYYLTATFNGGGNWPARLYVVDAHGGTPQVVREVAQGVCTVLADYDARKIVVASSALTPHTFAVVDMSRPRAEHHVSIDYDPAQVLPNGIYLLDVPGQGLSVAVALAKMFKAEHPEPASALSCVRLGAANATVSTLPLAALANVRVSGYVGGALPLQYQQVPEVRGNPLHILLSDPVGYATNIPRPQYIRTSSDPLADSYRLVAVNDSIDVLTPFLPPQPDAIDVLNKSLGVWHRISLPFGVSRVRAFGSWVTAISTESRAGTLASIKRTELDVAEIRGLRPSPGKQKRMTEELDRRWHVTADDLFDESLDFFPGDLLVLNGHTGQLFTIHTGEGDSEIVLATDESVYYRVNDGLYRADLVSGKLAKGIEIAEGPEIVQVHWAFLGPATATQ